MTPPTTPADRPFRPRNAVFAVFALLTLMFLVFMLALAVLGYVLVLASETAHSQSDMRQAACPLLNQALGVPRLSAQHRANLEIAVKDFDCKLTSPVESPS